jgi:hypothetical protein
MHKCEANSPTMRRPVRHYDSNILWYLSVNPVALLGPLEVAAMNGDTTCARERDRFVTEESGVW